MTGNGAPGASRGDERLRRLARLADVLSDIATVAESTTAVVKAGAEELDANSVSVCLLSADGSTFQLVASAGLRADMTALWSSFPVDAPVPVTDSVRERRLVLIDGIAERERRYPIFGVGPISSETLVVAPMVVHKDIVVGALTVGFAERRCLDDLDLAFIEAVAELCGQAVHRARLFDQRRRELARQRFLTQAATLLADVQDTDRTLAEVAGLAVAELAEVCAICLFDDDDVLRPVVAVHREPAGQAVVDELVARQPAIRSEQLLEVVQSGRPMFLPDLDTAERDARADDEAHLALITALDATGAIIVPMRTRGRVVGLMLMLATAGERVFDEDDRKLAEEFAAWSALAIDNSRLYAEQVELVEHLQTALASNRAVDQAKGVLGERYGISPAEAFDRMRRRARSSRRKLDDLAHDIIAGTDDLDA